VGDWIVGCRTFRKWRYRGRCHLGCSISPLLFTSLLQWISAPYKWGRHGFLPPPEINQEEVEFPRAPELPNGYHTVLIGCGSYGFVRLRTLNGYLIVDIFFLPLHRIMQRRGSAPKAGDTVMARLHMTYPGPGNTRILYSARYEP
jgi:hypothetical protein